MHDFLAGQRISNMMKQNHFYSILILLRIIKEEQVFYLVFKLMGQFTQAEVRTAKGRADAVVKTADYIYVFEFKLNGTAGEALKQIDEKGYLLPYTADGRRVVKVGVAFDAEKRNLGEWLIE